MSETTTLKTAPQALQADPVPSPLQLLRQLDGWLSETGHGVDHPWRCSIRRTLAANQTDVPTVGADPAAGLFGAIAEAASDLHELLLQVANQDGRMMGTAITSAAHLGWLADAAALARGGVACRGDAADWFLPPNLRLSPALEGEAGAHR